MIWPFFKISFDSSSSSSSSDHHQHHHHLLVAATTAAYSKHTEVRSNKGREVLRTRKVQFQDESKGRITKMARLQWTPSWSVGLLIVAPTLLLLLLVPLPYSTTTVQRLQMSSSTGVDSQLTSLSPGTSPLQPYNCCSIPFKSALTLLLHPRLFLPP
jgi:hypothetical protein